MPIHLMISQGGEVKIDALQVSNRGAAILVLRLRFVGDLLEGLSIAEFQVRQRDKGICQSRRWRSIDPQYFF